MSSRGRWQAGNPLPDPEPSLHDAGYVQVRHRLPYLATSPYIGVSRLLLSFGHLGPVQCFPAFDVVRLFIVIPHRLVNTEIDT